jgi:hypothetical protein
VDLENTEEYHVVVGEGVIVVVAIVAIVIVRNYIFPCK